MSQVRKHESGMWSATYRELLVSSWTAKTFDQVIAFLGDQLRADGVTDRIDAWTDTLESDRETWELLRRQLAWFHSRALPVLPKSLPRRTVAEARALAVKARQAVGYLLFEGLLEESAHSDLVRDTQSMLFLCCIHFLLPKLTAKGMTEEHDLVVRVLWSHCWSAWQHNLPHQQYLLGAVFHAVGDRARERATLRHAFLLTPPDEHDYLSKAQALLLAMLDDHRVDEAKQFLLEVARTAPREALDELKEMMADVYDSQAE